MNGQTPDQSSSPIGRPMRKKTLRPCPSQTKIDNILNPIHQASLHRGSHPYRTVLGDVRQKLVDAKRKMESLMGGLHTDAGIHYPSSDELLKTLSTVHRSLKEKGAGVIADGRLTDVIRRINCFGMCLMKMDIRQTARTHEAAMDEVLQYLKMGSYIDLAEAERVAFLTNELMGNRPLIPLDMPMSNRTRDVVDIFVAAAELGPSSLGAYVVSQPSAPSDVLLVDLFQKEAAFIVARQSGQHPQFLKSIRVVPMFETLKGLENASEIMKGLFSNAWYRRHIRQRPCERLALFERQFLHKDFFGSVFNIQGLIPEAISVYDSVARHISRTAHGNAQEVMLGYCDSGKDACRLMVTWSLYKCQEELVDLCRKQNVTLTTMYGRGGCMGRGGGVPLWTAVQSQPPGAINGKLRMIEQGEMVQAKFGVSAVAEEQLEITASATLLATLSPFAAPRDKGWADVMETLSNDSQAAYRTIIEHPKFDQYFKEVTPDIGLPDANNHRNGVHNGGIMKTVPWIFLWTQTRHVFPSWLGFGAAVHRATLDNRLSLLQDMYHHWPLFHSTVDLIEMILAKVDLRIAAVYDRSLVTDSDVQGLGLDIARSYQGTMEGILRVTSHRRLCDHNPLLRHLLALRNPFLDQINLLQVEILKELRKKQNDEGLRHALMITVNGIAAGMRNTG